MAAADAIAVANLKQLRLQQISYCFHSIFSVIAANNFVEFKILAYFWTQGRVN
jgi:hypothetical protein